MASNKTVDDKDMIFYSERLLNIMLHLGFTKQKDFAKALEIHPGDLSKVLSAERPLSVKILKALCVKFKINTEYIFSGSGNIQTEELPETIRTLNSIYKNNEYFRPLLDTIANDNVFRGKLGVDFHSEKFKISIEERKHNKKGRE